MKSDRQAPVVIVGAGFSGTMAAAELARRGLASILLECGPREGLGTAYSTDDAAHLLNVRAEGMSAWADQSGHFAEAFEGAGGDHRGFAERRFFGRYLRSILQASEDSGLVSVVHGRAVSAEPLEDGWKVALEGEVPIVARALILAIGNQPPEPLPFAKGERFINNPWRDDAKRAVATVVEQGGDVLLVGTGLTMIDLVLSLNSAGHRGRIVALSRRGLVPRAHGDFEPSAVTEEELPRGLLPMWRWLRRRSGEVGWRAAVDSLRPHSHALWQSLDDREQSRFLRHARPWWDVHRHRIAPQVAQQIRDLVAEGRLEVIAGRIADIGDDDNGLDVRIQTRRGTEMSRRFDFAFNCTGPLGRIERTEDLLLRRMLEEGLARPDALGMGLEVDAASRVEGSQRAWALGPLTKGRFWEIVAVPDIRVQAAAVAADVAKELGQ